MSDTENIVVAEEVVTKHDKHHEVVEAEEVTTNALHQANLADKVSVVEEANDEKLALHVIDLSYSPPKEFLKNVYEVLRGKMNELKIGWVFPSLREVHRTAYRHVPLRRINFTAVAGEVTAILGNHNERHQVISLLAGRTISGHYDGEIFLSGKGIDTTSYYYDKMAYVQRKPLYIPGISYLEMLQFSVQLKLQPKAGVMMGQMIHDRIEELVTLLQLQKCKDRLIPVYPELRGELGSDLRRLSIALEIVDLPTLIVIDEPTLGFEPAAAGHIMSCIQDVAKKGHIVVCSMSKPHYQELEIIDRLLLLSEGYSIYCNTPERFCEYFCSPELGYDFKKGVDLADFILDIGNGVERPTTQRTADLPALMQDKFESSDFFEYTKASDVRCNAFHPDFFYLYGYGRFGDLRFAANRIVTVVKRALYTRYRDLDTNRRQIGICCLLSLLCGYLQHNQGTFGNFALSLITFPYTNTANLTSFLFFTTAFTWAFPWLNVHVICQKLQLFRYEQRAGCCTSFAFLLGTILSEIPANLFFILIFANIVYYMVNLANGVENYFFFMTTIGLHTTLGLIGAYTLSTLLKKELVVRDVFLVFVTLCSLLSGFPFQLGGMKDYLADATQINPLRWTFESLLNWKFNMYEDGSTYLKTYSFQDFNHNHIGGILGNFIIVTFCIFIVFIQKAPNLLRRKGQADGGNNRSSTASRDSTGSDVGLPGLSASVPRRSTRQSELVKPVLYMRESSVTGRASKLSVNLSQVGEENMDRGPTVMFKDISFRIKDRSHPTGYQTLLNRVSGQFDWGKLSMILGGAHSGKTSLLNVLAGDTPIGAELSGKILFNGRSPDTSKPLWQRCAFVPSANAHYRDLTVKEIITFAMKLRCLNRFGYSVLDENVKKTIEILHMEEIVNQKSKKLNAGELKRLSIAEEIVHGPKLLLMDEPTTGVSLEETSILMTTFREMVNNDRTVIASVHQPSTEALKLFDTLLLLGKGRVIYHGSMEGATKYFINTPFRFSMDGYHNPADFLIDISSGYINDDKGEHVDASILENHYMQTEFYQRMVLRFKPKKEDNNDSNPLLKFAASGSKRSEMSASNLSMSSMPDDEVNISIEIDGDGNDRTLIIAQKQKPYALQILSAFLAENFAIPNQDIISNFYLKGSVLFYRSFLALASRRELLGSSLLLHVMLGVVFGWFMGDCSGTAGLYNTTSFFAIGSLFLILANVAFVFYMYNNNQVFLKENSRGLYSSLLKWTMTDWSFYVWRMINSIFFTMIVWGMTQQPTREDVFGFGVLSFMFLILTSVLLAENIVNVMADKSACYTSITGLGFMNFLFSGLFVKASSLPNWLSPWAPSFSMIRWNMQANYISVYDGAFPVSASGFSPYRVLLQLFGWGGKTKWYCFYMLIINVIIYKCVSFISSGITATMRRGNKRNVDTD